MHAHYKRITKIYKQFYGAFEVVIVIVTIIVIVIVIVIIFYKLWFQLQLEPKIRSTVSILYNSRLQREDRAVTIH